MNVRSAIVPLIILGSIVAVYFNSFWGSFQFDDYNVIVDNLKVHSLAAWFSDLGYGIRPVLKLTYTLNWVSGGGLFGFHLFNITVHALNSLLVFFLVRKFTGEIKSAFLAGMLFGLNPVQTEAVTYISGRSVSLMTLFYLSAVLAYIHGVSSHRRLWIYLISPAFFIIAVAAKEVALTLPLALLLWEKRFGSGEKFSAVMKRQAVHWVLLFLILIAFMLHRNYGSLLLYSLEQRSLYENSLSQINGVSYLLSRLVLVGGLNVDPDLPVLRSWSFLLVAKFTFLAGLLLFGVLRFRDKYFIGFGLIWFFLHILPTNSIIPRIDVANERQLYLANFGLFFALAVVFEKISVSRIAVQAAMISLLIICGIFTAIRNNDYRTEISLWKDTAKKSPHKARVFNNLGVAYELKGCAEEAAEAYSKALELAPGFAVAQKNLTGLVFRQRSGADVNCSD